MSQSNSKYERFKNSLQRHLCPLSDWGQSFSVTCRLSDTGNRT